MTFNDRARLDSSKVRRGGRGGTGVAVGGGTLLILFLVSQLFGVDLTGLAPATEPAAGSGGEESTIEGCETGADANADVDCRMVGAYTSLDDYWVDAFPRLGGQYASPGMSLQSGRWQTGCGAASSAMGPFYCPPDQSIYLDTAFFEVLTGELGADGGPLAEMYVVAHEWGHHIQNLSGTMDRIDRSDTGPTSDGVRLELQADCFAGAWAQNAQSTEDASGVQLLEPFTQEQLASAMDAAATVGDDHIQSSQGGSVNPEQWTHGSSESRQQWFLQGYENGPDACDTFAAGADV
ncbi:KPN_02809 family neutral zinc metallopeptidase [Pseudactinotalea suaedae]|uniref:KPN_02809 family neutral zinc metallopeptidase n=1 Tax=Pseudactinotalea suaedae TaxID=1524924 RepID=UPI0012E1336A|nr:neutral zinc metallopeptidase [Pseudactinotalea suaedae]